MNDVSRVHSWFDSGRLVWPLSRPTTVHLSRAIASLCGVEAALDDHARELAGRVGGSQNLVFVLADGFGMNLLDCLPASSRLHSHCQTVLNAVFPSSTAPALTSLATGCWPAEHGLLFWWLYLDEADLSILPLPFVERFSRRPLGEFGVQGAQLFVKAPHIGRFKRNVLWLQPKPSADSEYTKYCTAGTPVRGYQSLEEAIDVVVERVLNASEPTYTHLYFSGVDRAEHDHGPNSEEARSLLLRLDREMERLSEACAGRCRIVISADHGQFRVADSANLFVESDDELLEYLRCPPTGEGPDPAFHVRNGAAADFEACFRRRFGDCYALLRQQQVEDLHLLGPGPLSDLTRARLGDYLALTADPVAVRYRPESGMATLKGDHGGLSPKEMQVPLIII